MLGESVIFLTVDKVCLHMLENRWWPALLLQERISFRGSSHFRNVDV